MILETPACIDYPYGNKWTSNWDFVHLLLVIAKLIVSSNKNRALIVFNLLLREFIVWLICKIEFIWNRWYHVHIPLIGVYYTNGSSSNTPLSTSLPFSFKLYFSSSLNGKNLFQPYPERWVTNCGVCIGKEKMTQIIPKLWLICNVVPKFLIYLMRLLDFSPMYNIIFKLLIYSIWSFNFLYIFN